MKKVLSAKDIEAMLREGAEATDPTEGSFDATEAQAPVASEAQALAESLAGGQEGQGVALLSLPPPSGAVSTWAYAINQGTTNAAIAGAGAYTNGYDGIMGGTWASQNYSNFHYIGTQISSPSIFGVDNASNLVGKFNSKPCYVPAGCTNTSSIVTLPSITTGRPGEALWLPPTNGTPVGWSYYRPTNIDFARPTRWHNLVTNWQAEDLLSFDGNRTTPGYAYMANDSGVTVGKTRVVVNGTNAWRAFRTTTNLFSEAVNGLALPPKPTNSLPDLLNNTANGVNSTGDAVGATDYWYSRTNTWKNETRAVLWWAGQGGAANPTVLRTVEPNSWALWDGVTPGRSEALAVNRTADGVTVVGTSWTTPSDYARAFIMDVHQSTVDYSDWLAQYSHMLNLNDPHITWMPGGWVLTAAEAINDSGWVVGNGTYYGYYRAFVLVPQDVLLHGADRVGSQ